MRDSVSDKFLMTYKAGQKKPEIKVPDRGPAAWGNRPPDQLNEKPKGAGK